MAKSPLAAAAATAAGRGKKNDDRLLGSGATIRIGQEILCLLYAGFVSYGNRLFALSGKTAVTFEAMVQFFNPSRFNMPEACLI